MFNDLQRRIVSITGSFWDSLVDNGDFTNSLATGVANIYSEINSEIEYYFNSVDFNKFDYRNYKLIYPLFLTSAEPVSGWLDKPPFEKTDILELNGKVYPPPKLDIGSPLVEYKRHRIPDEILDASFISETAFKSIDVLLCGRDFYIDSGYIYLPKSFKSKYTEITERGKVSLIWLIGCEHIGIRLSERFKLLGNLDGLSNSENALGSCRQLLELKNKGLSNDRLKSCLKAFYGTEKVTVNPFKVPDKYTYAPVFYGKQLPLVTLHRGLQEIYYAGRTKGDNAKLRFDLETADKDLFWSYIDRLKDDENDDIFEEYVSLGNDVPTDYINSLEPVSWLDFEGDLNDKAGDGIGVVTSGTFDYTLTAPSGSEITSTIPSTVSGDTYVRDAYLEVTGDDIGSVYKDRHECSITFWAKFDTDSSKLFLGLGKDIGYEYKEDEYKDWLGSLVINFEDYTHVFCNTPGNRIQYYYNMYRDIENPFKLGEWTSITLTFSDYHAALYINGVSILYYAGRFSVHGGGLPTYEDWDLMDSLNLSFSKASVANLMVFNKVLSQVEINRLYDYSPEVGSVVGYADPLEVLYRSFIFGNNIETEVDIADIADGSLNDLKYLLPIFNDCVDNNLVVSQKINYYSYENLLSSGSSDQSSLVSFFDTSEAPNGSINDTSFVTKVRIS